MNTGFVLTVKAIFEVVLAWAFMGGAFYTWGNTLFRELLLNLPETERGFSKIWLGWGISVIFFSFIHLFCPITYIKVQNHRFWIEGVYDRG